MDKIEAVNKWKKMSNKKLTHINSEGLEVELTFNELLDTLVNNNLSKLNEFALKLHTYLKYNEMLSDENYLLFIQTFKNRSGEEWISLFVKVFNNDFTYFLNKNSTVEYLFNEFSNILETKYLISISELENVLTTVTSDSIKKVLNMIEKKVSLVEAKDRYQPIELAVIEYFWFVFGFVLKYELNLYDYIMLFEKEFVEHVCKIKPYELKLSICRFIPSYLENKTNYKSNMRSMSYLYYYTNQELEQLKGNVTQLESHNNSLQELLTRRNNQLTTLIDERDELLEKKTELEKQVTSQQEVIEKLKKDVELEEGRLIFETNQFNEQIKNQRNEIIHDIKYDLELELEAISDLTKYLSERDHDRIQRRLKRIEKLLSKY